jgi:selenocysteine-specific elongation factor
MDNLELIPVHVGLMGHIDAGKTSVARCLSEIVSTAGLDAHSQAQKRGITIDLGFTFFQMKNYIVTLVDAPGHADLIKSVFSAANIIDTAIIVVDAVEGPQVQTGEHLVVLDLIGIPFLFVVINKIDIANQVQLENTEHKIQSILNRTRFKDNYTISSVSSKNNAGFDTLKEKLVDFFEQKKIIRQIQNPLIYLIDHHFVKKGQGAIFTGTTIGGTAKVGDPIIILPLNVKTKIKSIEKMKKSSATISAGDRCGIAVQDVDITQIKRGCIATNQPEFFLHGQIIDTLISQYSLFNHSTKFGEQITVNHRMQSLTGRIFPYTQMASSGSINRFALENISDQKEYKAIIWLESEEFFMTGDDLLLSRLDLPPKTLRIMGTAKIQMLISPPIRMAKIKIKRGLVKNPSYSAKSVVVEGLAQSLIGAQRIVNSVANPPFSKITSTFGQNGNVIVDVLAPHKCEKGEEVFLKIVKDFELDFSKSYRFDE